MNSPLPDPPITLGEEAAHFGTMADRRRLRERMRTAFLDKAKRTSRSRRRWFRIREIEPDDIARQELIDLWRASIWSRELILNERSQVLCLSATPLLENYRLSPELARGEHFNMIVDDLWMSLPRWLEWFHQVEKTAPDWLPSAGKRITKPKSKAGAKPGWDWEDVKLFVFDQLNKRGDIVEADQMADWRSQNDVIKSVREYMENILRIPVENLPSDTTMKDRIAPMIREWQQSKAGN
jgi:hypothetical protein